MKVDTGMRVFAWGTLIFGTLSTIASLALGSLSDAFAGVAGPIWAGLFLVCTRSRDKWEVDGE